MPVNFQFMDQRLQTWPLCHHTYDSIYRCEEAVFAKKGLSTQQHAVLIAIKHIERPVTVSELAHWLERNQNGISTFVDRMVKDGLVSRKRDLPDRRSVQLVMTKKGKDLLEQATMSGLSADNLRMLDGILERMREKAFGYLNPDKSLEEIKTDEVKNMPRFLARMKRRSPDKR